MSGNTSVLDYEAGDQFPMPPVAGETDAETIANLLDHASKQSAAFVSLLSQLMSAAQVGFTSMYDGTNTISSAQNGILTLAEGGSATVTVDQATGTMTFESTGEENLGGEAMVVEINATASTTISAGLISISSTQVSDVGANADNTANNETFSQNSDIDALQTTNGPAAASADVTTTILSQTVISSGRIDLTNSVFLGTLGVGDTDADVTADSGQPSAWLTTKVEAGEIRITAGGDTVLLDQMLIDYANDWTDDNPSGLYMTTTKMGFFNTTTNTWPTVLNNDGTFSFTIDASNEVSHDGSKITVKAEEGKIGSATDYFDITNGAFQTEDTTNSGWVWIKDGLVEVRNAAGGGGIAFISMGKVNATDHIRAIFRAGPAASANGQADVFWVDDDNVLTQQISSTNSRDGIVKLHGAAASSAWLKLNSGGVHELAGTDLVSCSLAASSTIGAINGSALTNLTSGNLVGALPAISGAALTNLPVQTQLKISTYTGDGNATQGITGVGFQPDAVMVIPDENGGNFCHIKTSGMGGTDSKSLASAALNTDAITALDADGFTVGDGSGGGSNDNMNDSGVNYAYMAWKE